MDVSSWVAVLSVAISAIGLIAVAASIRILVRQMQSQSHSSIYADQLALDLFLFEHLDLKLHIENREPLPEDDPRRTAELGAVAELFVTGFEHVFYQRDQMAPETFDGWTSYMRDLARSPVISTYLANHEEWYAKDFLAHLRPHLAADAPAAR